MATHNGTAARRLKPVALPRRLCILHHRTQPASPTMPDLFSPFTLKGVTLRNRIAMSPMTMYRAVEGRMTDFHVMLMGSRAAGGFGLVFPEQIAITPDGRTGTSCAGIWDDSQIEGLARVTAIIKDMGAVPAIQLGHTGRKGSEKKPWEGKTQLPPDHPNGWQVRAPSAIPYGGRYSFPVHAVSVLKGHGLDLADLSLGMNTDAMKDVPFNQVAFMVDRANRVRREVDIPVAVSWNLGLPAVADRVIRQEQIDLVFLGRPALANPHWPVWAARELAHNDPFSLIPEDWSWWLRSRPGPEGSLGWPAAATNDSPPTS